MILGARYRANAEKTRFVTDPEVGGYVNDGVKVLMDRIIAANSSYYRGSLDFSFAGATEAGASQALPNDFGRMSVLWQFPDTPRQNPVFAIVEQDVNFKVGYYLNGNNITVSPYFMAPRGPWRLVYVPKSPQFGPAIDVVANDAVVVGGPTATWTFHNFWFTPNGSGDTQFVGTTLNVGANPGSGGNIFGQFVITAVAGNTCTTSSTGVSSATLGTGLWANLTLTATVSPYRAASITQLDQTMDTYDEVPELWAAYRILDKKKQLAISDVPTLLAAALSRVDAMAAGRQSEPVASPCLWRPGWNGIDPWGGGGFDGF